MFKIYSRRLEMRLRTLQKRKKMSMQAFADFLGVSKGWLSQYYHGKVVYPSGRLAAQIIERLDHKIVFEELMSMNGRGKKFSIFA
jgi:transcriptional regulator with XRE-family HTH domain